MIFYKSIDKIIKFLLYFVLRFHLIKVMYVPLLHIGYPKTATTWFQLQFYPNVANKEVVPREIIQDILLKPSAFEFYQKNDFDEIRNFKDKPAIICDELLVGGMHIGDINDLIQKEIATRIHYLFKECNIIIFLRNQLDMLVSGYTEYVKAGGTFNIKKYLSRKSDYHYFNNYFAFSDSFLMYDKLIDFYTHLFGKDKVYIFLYEDFKNDPFVFLSRYKETFNLEVDLDTLNIEPVNPSYSKRLLMLKRVSNHFTRRSILLKHYFVNIPYWYKYSNLLFAKLSAHHSAQYDPKKFLGETLYNYYYNRFKESNKNLIKKYNLEKIIHYDYPV